MYSETPHGAGALGLSELQGRALCLGEPQSQESLQGLQHHHLGVTGHMGENVGKELMKRRLWNIQKEVGIMEQRWLGTKLLTQRTSGISSYCLCFCVV